MTTIDYTDREKLESTKHGLLPNRRESRAKTHIGGTPVLYNSQNVGEFELQVKSSFPFRLILHMMRRLTSYTVHSLHTANDTLSVTEALHNIFTAIVQSVINYALPSFAGQLSKGDKSRINALFRKAVKRGLSHTALEIDELIDTADKRLSYIKQNPLSTSSSSTATQRPHCFLPQNPRP